MKTIRKGTIGQRIDFSIKENNIAVDLTSATIVANQYSFGKNEFVTSNSCVVVSATNGTGNYVLDLDNTSTTGLYYFIIDVTYTGGNKLYNTGESIEIYDEQESIVTPQELIKFMQIPSENAKGYEEIQQDIEFAETQLDLQVPELKNAEKPDDIKLKRQLILLKSAITYFMNMDENAVNPEKRLNKIKLWTDIYNKHLSIFGAVNSTSTIAIRTKSEDYSDPDSYWYNKG